MKKSEIPYSFALPIAESSATGLPSHLSKGNFMKKKFDEFEKRINELAVGAGLPPLDIEIWKDIPRYEGLYQASTFGNIKSYRTKFPNILTGGMSNKTGRILKAGKTKHGYLSVVLCKDKEKKNKLVHRLVSITFLYCPSESMDVNHKDGVKTNNSISNLEWCTRQENIIHSFALGLSKNNLPLSKKGLESHNAKSVDRIDVKTGNIVKSYNAIFEAVADGFNASGISECLSGRNKTAYGYKWRLTTKNKNICAI